MNATGVVYTPGVCRGQSVRNRVLTHTFGMHYMLTGVGIQTLFVHWLGCGRPQIAERTDEDTPLFCMLSDAIKKPLAKGYRSE